METRAPSVRDAGASRDKIHRGEVADLPLAFARMAVDPASPLPLYKQICRMLRSAILGGDLPAGLTLPTSHQLAASFGVSRNTIVTVYSLLATEGFLNSNTRRGTRVAELPLNRAQISIHKKSAGAAFNSQRSSEIPSVPVSSADRQNFAGTVAGLVATQAPDPSIYPLALGRHIGQEFSSASKPDAALREFQSAICGLLRQSRGVQCEPFQVLPVRTFKHAIDLVGRVLIDPGHWLHVENPSDGQAWRSLQAAGAQVRPMKEVESDSVDGPVPRIIAVSPSASFPYGQPMPEERRNAVLEAALNANALLFEDDRWWDLSYSGRQPRAIQSADCDGRVLYFGSLLEALGPQIKVGYLVVPGHLVNAFSRAQPTQAIPGSFILSAVAKFVSSSDFPRHLQAIRSAYSRRQTLLASALRPLLKDTTILEPSVGLALAVRWHDWIDEAVLCRAGDSLNVALAPLSHCFHGASASPPRGIVVGAGTVPERIIDSLATRIAETTHSGAILSKVA